MAGVALLGAGGSHHRVGVGVDRLPGFLALRGFLGVLLLRDLGGFRRGHHRRGVDHRVLVLAAGGHRGQGRAVVLGDVAVGAHIAEQRVHGGAGQVDAVAALHIARLRVASGLVLEGLGAVQKLPVLLLAHLHQRLVELVHLRLGQRLVGMALAQRRDGVDDDVHAGIRLHDALDAGLIVGDEFFGAGAGAKVVGAEGEHHPFGLHQRHRLRHRLVAGIALEPGTGKGGQAAGRHAHRADGVVRSAVIEQPVHAGGVAVAQEQRFVHVGLTRVGGQLQNGGAVLGGVDDVLVFIVAALHHHRSAVHGFWFIGCVRRAVDQQQRRPGCEQQCRRAACQHHVHLGADAHFAHVSRPFSVNVPFILHHLGKKGQRIPVFSSNFHVIPRHRCPGHSPRR